MSETRIGTPTLRAESADKITGLTRFTADVYLPDLLHAKAVRSPYPHARIVRIDTSEALRLPGVVAVITARDLPDRKVGRKLKDMPMLAADVVRFIGERVAVVAAEDPRTAALAAELVNVEYEPLPAVSDPFAAMAPDAPLIHPGLATYEGYAGPFDQPNVCYRQVWQNGDLAAGFAAADIVLERVYRTQPQHQAYMEPRVCQVALDRAGKVTVWSSNKAPFILRRELAEYTGLPEQQFNVISTNVGGDFGGKGTVLAEPICFCIARRTGRPVRFAMSRDEEFTAGNPRHGSVVSIKAGVTRDGRIQAWQARVIFNAGAYAAHNIRIAPGGGNRAVGPYRIPHCEVEALSVYTNVLHHGHMRAPGDPQTTFAAESHMDALAGALQMDPLQFRLLNAIGRHDPSPLGKEWRDNYLRETILLAADTHKAAGPPPAPPPGYLTGTGMACAERYNGSGRSGARLRLEPDGSITVITGAIDAGTGLPTLLRQIAAEALDLPLTQISVALGDTDQAPYDQGIGSSRHTPVAGGAVLQAAGELRRKLFELAQERLECPPELLHYTGGRFWILGVPRPLAGGLSLRDLAQTAAERQSLPEGTAELQLSIPPETCFAAAVADVAVDPATGHLLILRVVSAHDVGRALNPPALRGQIEGAVVQGLGFATTEELVWDEQGQVVTATFSQYGTPNAMMIPEIVPVWFEGAASPGPFGAKSVAEAALTPVAPAIANAVRAALGLAIPHLPLTPERIRAAVRGSSNAQKHQPENYSA